MCNVKIGFIQSCFLAYMNLMRIWVIVGINDDDYDDDTDKIPNRHLGFFMLVFSSAHDDDDDDKDDDDDDDDDDGGDDDDGDDDDDDDDGNAE